MIEFKGNRTRENTIDVLAKYEYENYCISSNLTFYKDMDKKQSTRDAALKADEAFENFEIELWMREPLYNAIIKFT